MDVKRTDISLLQTLFSAQPPYSQTPICATCYAPRDRERLYMLGAELSHRCLYPLDPVVRLHGTAPPGSARPASAPVCVWIPRLPSNARRPVTSIASMHSGGLLPASTLVLTASMFFGSLWSILDTPVRGMDH
jgi:hypothetical protein